MSTLEKAHLGITNQNNDLKIELEREKQESHDKITDLEVKLQEANLLKSEY